MTLEFISYKDYPNDQFTKAIITFLSHMPHLVAYAKKVTKDGREFWVPATFGVTEGTQKAYVEGYMLNNRSDDNKVKEFIRQHAKAEVPRSMDEVSRNFDGLPF